MNPCKAQGHYEWAENHGPNLHNAIIGSQKCILKFTGDRTGKQLGEISHDQQGQKNNFPTYTRMGIETQKILSTCAHVKLNFYIGLQTDI